MEKHLHMVRFNKLYFQIRKAALVGIKDVTEGEKEINTPHFFKYKTYIPKLINSSMFKTIRRKLLANSVPLIELPWGAAEAKGKKEAQRQACLHKTGPHLAMRENISVNQLSNLSC